MPEARGAPFKRVLDAKQREELSAEYPREATAAVKGVARCPVYALGDDDWRCTLPANHRGIHVTHYYTGVQNHNPVFGYFAR